MSNILTNNINARSGNTITIGKAGDTVSIAGTLSYEDVSSVDSVGIITAQAGIRVTGGSIGIGTDSPVFELDVQKDVNTLASFIRSADGDSFVRINSHTGNIVGLQLGDNTDVDKQQIRADNTNDALIFNTANSEKLRIDSNGNIGVGVTIPADLLDIREGDIVVGQTSGASTNLRNYIKFGRSDNPKAAIGFLNNLSNGRGNLIFMNSNANDSNSFTDSEERMRIDPDGRVGINTTAPTKKFEILVSATNGSRIHTDLAGSSSKFLSWVIDGGIANNDSRSELDFNHGGTTWGSLYTGYSTSSNTATSFVLRTFNSDTDIRINPNSTNRAIFATDGALYIGASVGDGTTADAGVVKARGYNCKQGYNGSLSFNQFNINWTGSQPQLWIDTSNVGTISVSSDYRVKDNVVSITSTCIDRIKQLRPVQYEYANYGSLFTADGVTREGFIAHEVQEVIPSGAQGVKDDPNEIQSLKVDAILSVTVKALQEAIAKIETLETQNADLVTRIETLEQA